jgi:hypothetical protein
MGSARASAATSLQACASLAEAEGPPAASRRSAAAAASAACGASFRDRHTAPAGAPISLHVHPGAVHLGVPAGAAIEGGGAATERVEGIEEAVNFMTC